LLVFLKGGSCSLWQRGFFHCIFFRENVCIEREETVDDEEEEEDTKQNESDIVKAANFFSTSISLSNCHESPSKYECVTKINNHGVVKTFVVRYKCCYGFKRSDDSSGCTKQVKLSPLLTTIEDVGGKELTSMIRSTGLEDKFNSENLTVLVPTDDSMIEFADKMVEMNQVPDAVRRRRQVKNPVSSKNLVLNHAIPGFIDLSELNNEDLLSSAYDSKIRFNFYPTRDYGKMLTANCVKVRKGDNLATNGIVHVVDGVLGPVTEDILSMIEEHPQLSTFRRVLKNSNLEKNIKPDGHYTIFAPTNDAFGKLPPLMVEKLLNGDACTATIIKHHIVAHTVCSSAIIGNATTHSVDGQLLNLQRRDDDVLLFESNAKIVKTDIMGTNGVIHLIDTLVVPESALYISQSLKNENFTKFQALLDQVGLTDELDSMKNITVFAPSDAAFENPKALKYIESLQENKEKLKEMVMYHVVEGHLESCDMNNNVMLKTKQNENSVRLNLYSTLPIFSNIINRATVNCARLTGYDEKSCGSVIHEVNNILIPPSRNLWDEIKNDEKYSTLSQILKGTDLETVLKDEKVSLTVLIPTNDAFSKLDPDDLKELMEDKKKAVQLLKNHILTEVLCCSGVSRQGWGFDTLIRTLNHQHQSVSRHGEQIRIGGASVLECDDLATNGVIHTINKVLLPQQTRSPGFGFFLFDI
ncbi:transforming growth factor-beta-induced protein ig-h3-like, partial [Photinus pyralis]